VKRGAVASYLASVVINGREQSVPRLASRFGFVDQVMPNSAQCLHIGCAFGLFLFFAKPERFFGGIRAGGGSILSLGHGAFEANRLRLGKSSH
jgi:hypothetical protein